MLKANPRDGYEETDAASGAAPPGRKRRWLQAATVPYDDQAHPLTQLLRRPFAPQASAEATPSRQAIPEGPADSPTLRRDALYKRLLAVADVTAAAATLFAWVPALGNASPSALAVLCLPMIVVFGKIAGLYDRDEHVVNRTTLDETPTVVMVVTLSAFFVAVFGSEAIGEQLGRVQLIGFWAGLLISMLVFRTAARRLARALASEERCLVLGKSEVARWLEQSLQGSHVVKARVVGRVPLEPDPPGTNGVPVLGDFETLGIVLVDREVDRVVIAPGASDADHVLDAIRRVKALGVKVSVLPSLSEVVGSSVEFDEIDGVPLLGLRRHGLSRSSRRLKRAFDLVAGLSLLLLLAPLMTVIALAIKLDSGGPALFRQRRMGRDDVPFYIFKFRTMVDGAEAQKAALMSRNEAGGGLFKMKDDPRVTRVGRLLRRTSLDELPQLINVLRGEMALVGPRPLVVDEDRCVEGWHRRRLLIPPGMTGLWQVLGSARIPLDEMVKIDYLYGVNWSLWLDVKILLRTAPVVFGRRGL